MDKSCLVDSLLESDPRRALAVAEQMLNDGVGPGWLTAAVLGSARRANGQFSGAAGAFSVAISLACNESAHLELAKRIGRLWIDLGDYQGALELAEWRHSRNERCPLARADLALAIFATSGDLLRARDLLEPALGAPDPILRRGAWHIATLIAIETGDCGLVTDCLNELEALPHTSGQATRYLDWLRGLALRSRGQFEQARDLLLRVVAEAGQANEWPAAGVALVDAALCAAQAGDWQTVQRDAGKAFSILAGLSSREASAPLLLFVKAAAAQRLDMELLLAVRKRLQCYVNHPAGSREELRQQVQ